MRFRWRRSSLSLRAPLAAWGSIYREKDAAQIRGRHIALMNYRGDRFNCTGQDSASDVVGRKLSPNRRLFLKRRVLLHNVCKLRHGHQRSALPGPHLVKRDRVAVDGSERKSQRREMK